ncbi:hypothetical protein VM1G_05811 [Cytospora mali]|uniref:Uncharacterized protein n=1 Tax=Cytospora mali TaxID=578113 RepID=A0A194W283_CYTMA|nr:hypothetical protein VM1G_05811 [Valsa mali]
MANPEKGKSHKVPSRAASLQRMLEMERKQKMERMQQNPYAAGSGRRSESPVKSSLLTRRRDTSQPPDDHRRTSTVRNYSLPPPSAHSKPPHSSRTTQDKSAKQTQSRKMASSRETKKGSADRDDLPSMKRAAASPQVKTVTFLPSDDDKSDTSSICHSPTWDGYGKRRKERDGAAREAKSSKRRLTKEPPPAAMDNRPGLNPRIMSAPLLDRTSFEDNHPSDQPPMDPRSRTTRPQPLGLSSHQGSVESVHTVNRSPAFIGGVRLERERDATMRRLKDSRAPSVERSEPEMPRQHQASQPPSTEPPKRRETAPPVSYPPIASKTPFLKHTSSTKGHGRKRSGSFSNVVSKLFGSSKSSQDSQPYLERRDSQDSVTTVRSLLSLSKGSRGRQRDGSATPQSQSRAQSRDNHSRSTSTPIDERRGAIGLPPLSWKNSRRKKRTTSMVAIPPQSVREGSLSPDTSAVENDKFSFLERPFTPPADGPPSPTASLSASMKAKVNPQTAPAEDSRPASPPPKKTLKETIKAGFRSSMSMDTKPSHHRIPSDDTFVVEVESAPVLSHDSHPLQSHPVIRPRTSDRPPSSSRGPRRSDEHHAGKRPQTATDTKDSGASTSSSHPDSESAPPSPATTPDTSRPQSSKENRNLRAEDLKKLPLLSLHMTNASAMKRPLEVVFGSSSKFSTQANSLQGNAEPPKGSSKEPVSQQTAHRSNFIEDLPDQSPLIHDEPWSRSKPPLETDQLSFTSALTNLDVKRSESVQDLGSDVGPFTLDKNHQDSNKATKVTLKRIQVETTKSSGYAKKQAAPEAISPVSSVTDTSFFPSPPHQSLPPRASGRPGHALLPPIDVDHRFSSSTQSENPDSFLSTPTTASAYLHEARKAAPSSPRAPTAKTPTSSTNPLPTSSNSLAPRAFVLAQPKATAAEPPIAKMFVECCHCKFYQDMPSRVYEAMARPEDTVRDKRLGVSGQVTTCVKCPWCSHNMSTQCCAGFAAVVYLREKLHGP